MVTILVTGVGGAAGVGAVRSLQERTEHEIIGVDMNPQAAGLYLADRSETVPAATDDYWATEISSVAAELDVDIIVPTVDEELSELPALFEELPDDISVISPRLTVIETALDKYRTYQRLVNAGHSVPKTWVATERANVDATAFPLLVKPRRGRGSRGITRVEDETELNAHINESTYDPESLLLQELITGTEYTTSVVSTRDGRLLSVVPKEALLKEGSTVTGVTRNAPTVRSACQKIHDTLDPRGPINIQQIVGDDGTPYTIEINPRFSSTSCLTAAAGVDEFDLLIRDAIGEFVATPEGFETDLYIQRYQSHLFVPGEEFMLSEEEDTSYQNRNLNQE